MKSALNTLVALILLAGSTVRTVAQESGWIDLSNTSLSAESSSLEGNWEFYANRLLPAQSSKMDTMAIARFPQLWDADSGIDFGTYRLHVLLPAFSGEQELALEVPHFFSSYMLWVNGQLLGKNGTPASTKEATVPAWKPSVYSFVPGSDTLDIVLQVANFYHVTGGTRKSIHIAEAAVLLGKSEWIRTMDYILLFTLVGIGVISLCLTYINRGNYNPFLFLSFFVLVWALHSACSNQYRILEWMPISWEWMVKLEHLTIFLTIITALLFISSLFPREFNNRILRVSFPAFAVGFSAFALVAAPITFTAYLKVYMLVAIALIIYVIVAISKAFVYERAGATLMLITIILGALTFGYVVLSYLAIIEINMIVYNLSFIILFTMLTISMWVRVAKMNPADETDILTFDQVHKERR
jgi:hypothetical protein